MIENTRNWLLSHVTASPGEDVRVLHHCSGTPPASFQSSLQGPRGIPMPLALVIIYSKWQKEKEGAWEALSLWGWSGTFQQEEHGLSSLPGSLREAGSLEALPRLPHSQSALLIKVTWGVGQASFLEEALPRLVPGFRAPPHCSFQCSC